MIFSCLSLEIPLFFLLKLFEFGNGSKMSGEKFVPLEFKYLKNKKWYK